MQARAGGPFGAVVVKDNQIIAEGRNQVTSTHDPTAHAEMVAIRAACKALDRFDLRGCTVYSSCEPCPMCLGAIYWARLDALYFANSREDAAQINFDDEKIYVELQKEIHDRELFTQQIRSDEALKIFEDWTKLEGRTEY